MVTRPDQSESRGDASLDPPPTQPSPASAIGPEFKTRPDGVLPLPGESAVAETTTLGMGAERPGAIIGHYKLLQQIGEGGFGVVFMAEQHEPVQRKVAIKIIKLGMETRQVIARFEQERQALALMNHPHIAHVLDAGATDTGRPYFVMELCPGEPITQYADREHLTIRERLELFAQVCHAVQHAHQKGVIHRDLKPSNVLVSTQDGQSHAKVIDFGIAKATAARLTEKTLFTERGHFIGTPQYVSPEQAAGSLDIDTRSDVYSLGVLLYELLTGSTPFDPQSLRSAAYAEIVRIIREVEPPKPSTRLSRSTDTLPSVAASRRIEPKKLGALIRGDLDWIIMKALEKDRARRYETANGLAADISRHLNHEPVEAGPPNAAYRLWKFVRRNRGPVMTAVLATLTLLAGLIGTTTFALRESRQRDIAQSHAAQAREAATQAEKERERVKSVLELYATTLFDSSLWQRDPRDPPWQIVERVIDRASESSSTFPPLPSQSSVKSPERLAAWERARKEAARAIVHLSTGKGSQSLESLRASVTAWKSAFPDLALVDQITLEMMTVCASRLPNVVSNEEREDAVDLLERLHDAWDGLQYPADFRAVGKVLIAEGFASAGKRERAVEVAERALESLSVGRYEASTIRAHRLLVELYDAWNAAEPGKGYDAKATEWRVRLDAWRASTQPLATQPTKP